MNRIIESDRIYLREMVSLDLDALATILQDETVMYAYEHAFSNSEVETWLQRQLQRYEEDGFGLWAVIDKANNEMIGQCGLTRQDIEGKQVVEVGYLFAQRVWHQGFASEAARLVRDYAFDCLQLERVYSIIRDQNIPSQKVAKANGMKIIGSFVKHYYGMDMPHDIWCVENPISKSRINPSK